MSKLLNWSRWRNGQAEGRVEWTVAIPFKDDVGSLVNDLNQLGYSVEGMQTLQGSPGRTADIILSNQVIVCWDRFSEAIWVIGPYPLAKRVEYLLQLYYDGPLPVRFLLHLWRASRWRITRTFAKKAVLEPAIETDLQSSS